MFLLFCPNIPPHFQGVLLTQTSTNKELAQYKKHFPFNFPSFLHNRNAISCHTRTNTHTPQSRTDRSLIHKQDPHTSTVSNIPASHYLRQPAVLVRAVSHSRWRGLQLSSPPSFPRSQPECGTITSSDNAWSAWSTISIFTES